MNACAENIEPDCSLLIHEDTGGLSSHSLSAQEQPHEVEAGIPPAGPNNFHQFSKSVGALAPPMSDSGKRKGSSSQDSSQLLKPLGPWRSSTLSHPGDEHSMRFPVATTSMKAPISSRIQQFWERNRSCMLVVISSVFSSAMALFTKILELDADGMDAFQILFIRMAVTTTWCTSLLCWEGAPNSLMGPKEVRGLLLLRGVSGFFGIVGIWSAIKFLSLADASVVTFLTPSIVGFYSAIFLRQPYTRKEQLASLVALAGVVFIARPSFLFGSFSPSGSSSPPTGIESPAPVVAGGGNTTAQISAEGNGNAAHRLTGILFALLSAFGGAGAFIAIRAIGDRCHVLTTTNFFAGCCTLISATALAIAPVVGYDQPHVRFGLPHDSKQWILVSMITSCGFLAQWFLTAGLGSEQRSNKAPAMVYTGMLWTAGFDRFFLGQNMYWSSLLGCALIVGSAVWVVAMPKPRDMQSEAVDTESAAGTRAHAIREIEETQESVQMRVLR
ncbi:hypothetical protein diail_4851 [Diaporthe ilicicola]|nr:hypothetical protein diail_4851 [Diaporthe ilicicola]